MDFSLPKEILDPTKEATRSGIFGYRELPKDYFEVFKAWYRKHRHIDLEDDAIFFSDGAMDGLTQFFYACLKSADGIIYFPPVYQRLKEVIDHCNLKGLPCNAWRILRKQRVIDHCNLKGLPCPLAYDEDRHYFNIDFSTLEKILKAYDVKALILCHPHNPSGRIWKEEEILSLLYLCEKYDLTMVVDEVHFDLNIADHPIISPLKIALDHHLEKRVLILHAIAKAFNLSGLSHCHVITFDHRVQNQLRDYQIRHSFRPNVFAILPSYYAYLNGDDWLRDLKDLLSDNYRIFNEALRNDLEYPPLEATYLLFVNLKDHIPDRDAAKVLEEKAHIIVNGGAFYDEAYKSWARINLATSQANIETLIKRLKDFIKKPLL